ncbi:unnamed protein product [Caenorhabditis bovis]|uniref:Uncharacterized protein n=1 Tax=Caenorhabditis bovis TaxID=2654633 RepID=A0A8S1EE27_9PELO|nr:unnamed protein product [Caenorhabditis bovis]
MSLVTNELTKQFLINVDILKGNFKDDVSRKAMDQILKDLEFVSFEFIMSTELVNILLNVYVSTRNHGLTAVRCLSAVFLLESEETNIPKNDFLRIAFHTSLDLLLDISKLEDFSLLETCLKFWLWLSNRVLSKCHCTTGGLKNGARREMYRKCLTYLWGILHKRLGSNEHGHLTIEIDETGNERIISPLNNFDELRPKIMHVLGYLVHLNCRKPTVVGKKQTKGNCSIRAAKSLFNSTIQRQTQSGPCADMPLLVPEAKKSANKLSSETAMTIPTTIRQTKNLSHISTPRIPSTKSSTNLKRQMPENIFVPAKYMKTSETQNSIAEMQSAIQPFESSKKTANLNNVTNRIWSRINSQTNDTPSTTSRSNANANQTIPANEFLNKLIEVVNESLATSSANRDEASSKPIQKNIEKNFDTQVLEKHRDGAQKSGEIDGIVNDKPSAILRAPSLQQSQTVSRLLEEIFSSSSEEPDHRESMHDERMIEHILKKLANHPASEDVKFTPEMPEFWTDFEQLTYFTRGAVSCADRYKNVLKYNLLQLDVPQKIIDLLNELSM